MALDHAEQQPFADWREAVKEPVAKVATSTERLRRDRRVLVILLGAEAEIQRWLEQLASDGESLIRLSRERVEAGRTTPAIRTELNALWTKFGYDQARFVEYANKAAGIV